jgi:L-idonate 5-dehydrogenase
MKTMKAFVLHGPKEMRLEERAVPAVSPGDVLIRVRRTGICGSDVHYYTHGQIGSFVPKAPFALGHEFAGEVAELGEGVQTLAEGDRVAIDPQLPCGRCRFCRLGRYNLCLNMRFLGSASCFPHIDGGFGQYVVVPEANCHPIPAGLDYGYAALLEPLTIATHAVLRTQVAGGIAGKRLLITGAGTIGQLVLIVARAYGASVVAVSDVEEFPRRFALDAGADYAFDPRGSELAGFAAGDSIDVVIEVSGSPRALAQSLTLIGRGGTLVQVGTQPAAVELPANLVMSKELAVLGSFRSAHAIAPALDLISSSRVDLSPIISSVFPFSRFNEAMEVAVAKERVIKVQVEQESSN